MSGKDSEVAADQNETVEIAYGDTFRHTITNEKKVVQDVRKESDKVVWGSGGWDYEDELVAAVKEEPSIYDVVQRHDDWEDTPF